MDQILSQKLAEERKKILDFSARNKLLNYKHTSKGVRQNYLRIVNEIPEYIIRKLDTYSKLELIAKPKEIEFELEVILESNADKDKDELFDDKIQVIEENPKFELSCNNLRNQNRIYNQEKGINILNIVIGFLEWYELKGITGTEEKRLSPLAIYPVGIEKRKTSDGYKYFLETAGEDMNYNVTLWQKLEKEYGIKMPKLEFDEEGKANIKKLFQDVNTIINKKNKSITGEKWNLKEWSSLGLFPFMNISIYNDLDFESWDKNPCDEKELMRSFLLGNVSEKIEPLGSEEVYQDKEEINLGLDSIPKLIADADSTQYRVIKKAIEGKSFVVEGPPGTGKSQTITNMISSLIGDGKKVLFAADKLAALEVVKNRLSERNLGDFLLEVHSTATPKNKVIESLKNRVERKVIRYNNQIYREDLGNLKKLRSYLNEHYKDISEDKNLNKNSYKVFDLIGEYINYSLNKEYIKDKKTYQSALQIDVDQISDNDLKLISENLDIFIDSSRELEKLGKKEFIEKRGLPKTSTNFTQLITYSKEYIEKIQGLLNNENISPYSYKDFWNIDKNKIKNLIESLEFIKSNYPVKDNHSLKIESKEDLGKLLNKLYEREIIEEEIGELKIDILLEEENYKSINDIIDYFINNFNYRYSSGSIKNLISDCKKISSIFRKIKQELNKNVNSISANISLSDIQRIIECKENYESIQIDLVCDILDSLKGPNKLKDINKEFEIYELICKNVALKNKIQNYGVEISELLKIDINSLLRSIEAIKDAGFLGCFLNPKLRKAKKIWKIISKEKTKLPSFKRLAVIFNECQLFIQGNSQEEDHFKESSGLINERIFKLREKAVDIQIPSELKEFIVFYVEKELGLKSDFDSFVPIGSRGQISKYLIESFKNIEINNNTDQKLSEIINQSSIHQIATDSDISFNSALEDTNKYLSELTVKISLLDNYSKEIIYDLSLLDLGEFGSQIKKLNYTAKEINQILNSGNNIFEGENLGINLKAKSIENFLKDYGKLNFDTFPLIVKESLDKFGLDDCIKNLNKLEKLREEKVNIFGNLQLTFLLNEYLEQNLNSDYFNQDPNFIINELKSLKGLSPYKNLLSDTIRNKNILQENGVKKGINQIYKLNLESGIKASKLFKAGIIGSRIRKIGLEDILSNYSGRTLNRSRKLFNQEDINFVKNTSKTLSNYLNINPSPLLRTGNQRGRKQDYTEGYLIQHEVNKKTRFLALMRLFKQSFKTILSLKPCLMMSPSSAAELLPKSPDIFDVLIIDEASQMKPQFAISLIARCKQIIIVGDDKQLPPSNYFETKQQADDDDEEIDVEDSESILDLSVKVLGKDNNCKLGWHYRSKHHSLIAFSNWEFYNGDLTIFPTNKKGTAITYLPVENPNYKKGGANLTEVKYTIEVLKNTVKKNPDKSILIATMNERNSSDLRLELEKEINSDPILEEFSRLHQGTLNELVVKNLENVQGDERDIVIISTVFGPDASGIVGQNFGPINKANGHRRLNVLFTRAKHEVIVVSSLKPSDIRIDDKSSRGKRAFRNYLEYAQTGQLSDTLIRQTNNEFDSPFEVAVYNALTNIGHKVDTQIGVSNYKIDMGIIDPSDSSKYILAIECDGKAYHSSYNARARDRLRQQVLESLGWDVYRIWSTDWFRDPDKEIRNLDNYIQSKLAQEVKNN